ncbi:DUF6412 domain-containing protein [Microbacterium esteraromaticum]|uniref:DUF6412 domain-containing protein n=1 Tax=Microbacterium esteraromaticum TaxID=57043 RepID=UPI0021BD5D3A|nr:DUF6412 domain-containing protein [Microbacterium esteraromaticum]
MSTLLQLLLSALGAVPMPLGGMLGMAAVLVALAVVAMTLAVLAPQTGIRSAPHALRWIDLSTRLAQSHPDADGHPRPRAPGATFAA